jgi:hypothetical protein
MNWSARLQFQRLPPEAQRAALWRLAWNGLSIEQIGDRIGWSPEQVRRTIDEETAGWRPPWRSPAESRVA